VSPLARVVPVRTNLSVPAARALFAYAETHGTTVDAILADVADRVTGVAALVDPVPPTPSRRAVLTRKPHIRMTPSMIEVAIRRRNAGDEVAAIARDLGVSCRTVSRHAPKPNTEPEG